MQNPCQDSYYTLFSSYPMLLNYHEEQAMMGYQVEACLLYTSDAADE